MADDKPDTITVRILGDPDQFAAITEHIAKQLEPITALSLRIQESPVLTAWQEIGAKFAAMRTEQWAPLEALRELAGIGLQDQLHQQLAPTMAALAKLSEQSAAVARSLDVTQFRRLQPTLAALQYVRAETVEQAVAAGTITAEQVRTVITVLVLLLISVSTGAWLGESAAHDEWQNLVGKAIGTLLGFLGAWPQIEKMIDQPTDN